MSYQVLARKYRPKSFQTLVGQEHVVRALTHALEQQRLHHAYLFTGTRGVGKTTLSRILAKSLNCELGITANPCGKCDACVAIDAGRFVDYIEMDAASNRGVDEMAQLLEQAVYAPSNARFKVYMIDEVHMLTNHAFNSMLKTLEEPPAHVKFILATTDPQKIPVTVLSRCLQFNLKQMPLPSIVSHLENILGQEQISFELPGLRLLAQGAQGSMRDALSLTDQAIAYAAGKVTLEAVQGMLGALDQSYLIKILDALAQQDGASLLEVADQMQTRSLSYKAALQDLATLLHQLSVAQLVPTAIAEDIPERSEILRLAAQFDAEQIQLFYQIAVHGRNELGLAPDEYAGFSMTLLRMLAFRPVTSEPAQMLTAPAAKAPNSGAAAHKAVAAPARIVEPVQARTQADPAIPTTPIAPVRKSPAMAALEAITDRRGKAKSPDLNSVGNEPGNFSSDTLTAEKKTELKSEVDPVEAPRPLPVVSPLEVNGIWLASGGQWDGNWPQLAASLPLRGVAQQLAQQSELISCEVQPAAITLGLRVPLETLLASASVEKLAASLSENFTVPVKLNTEIGAVQKTAHAAAIVSRAQRQDQAELAIKSDQVVQGLMRVFGATIVPGSVKSIN
ncbi:DNA polymerase-3 subunit gamma/tau [Oxalobacteraceae bacterium GrIS 2.11]